MSDIITAKSIADLKNQNNLTDILREYGMEPNRNGFCLCPFHHEDTPSFRVHGQRWICFGCGDAGDVIDFVMRMEGCSFTEAFDRLGGRREAVSQRKSNELQESRRSAAAQRNALEELYCQKAALFRTVNRCLRELQPVSTDVEAKAYAAIYVYGEAVEQDLDDLSERLRRGL